MPCPPLTHPRFARPTVIHPSRVSFASRASIARFGAPAEQHRRTVLSYLSTAASVPPDQSSSEVKPMSEDKTYTIAEIRAIAQLCRAYDCETFALDLLFEGLDVSQTKRRLESIDQELQHKYVSRARKPD
jgi:hypothetical protein